MKIGIVSMQRICNYGSFLQAYGLKTTIENLGHEVIFIDYKTEVVNVQGRKISLKERMRQNSFLVFIKDNIDFYLLHSKKFSTLYRKQYLKQLGVRYKHSYYDQVDIAIVGSDEVFNCTQGNATVGFSPMLFGHKLNAKKVISYAASFGFTTIERINHSNLRKILENYLKNFSLLSVRDLNSYNIIKELVGIEPYIHLDPVLISDFELPSISRELGNYAVLYTYKKRNYTEDDISSIKNFCKNNNVKLISIGASKEWADIQIEASPLEALAYIAKACYVITDTFHGTVFSIKYNRNFVTLVRKDNFNKLHDLLLRLKQEKREIACFSQINQVLQFEPDYKETNQIIEECRNASISYLTKALSK